MRSIHKLKTVASTQCLPQEARYVEGHVVALQANGKVAFRDEAGAKLEARVPRSVDRRWLSAALLLAPVPAFVMCLESPSVPVLAYVFSAPEHEALDDHFRVDAKTIELTASESVQIRTGRSTVTVCADGEIRVRGKNITSRASNLNRVRGGTVRIN